VERIITALQSGVDREHICGAIFSMRTLDSVLYGSLIVSCLFPSANKGTWSKGMIEFGYHLVTSMPDLPTPHFSFISFASGATSAVNLIDLFFRAIIDTFVVVSETKEEKRKQISLKR